MTPAEIEALPYRPCVGLMMVNAEGKVFVGARIDNPEPAWQMPQGGIDPGEEPLEAAFRELGEEIGVGPEKCTLVAESEGWHHYDLPHDLVPRIWKGRFRGQKQKWFLLRFQGQDTDINIETEHPEFREWTWLSVADLPHKIVPFKKEVYAAVAAEFGPKIT